MRTIQYGNHPQTTSGFFCNCSCGCPCALHPPGWREGSSTSHSSAHFHRSNPTPVRKKTCQNASFIKFPFIMGRCAIYCGPLWKMLGSNDTVRWGCLRHLSGKKKMLRLTFKTGNQFFLRSCPWRRPQLTCPYGHASWTWIFVGRNCPSTTSGSSVPCFQSS